LALILPSPFPLWRTSRKAGSGFLWKRQEITPQRGLSVSGMFVTPNCSRGSSCSKGEARAAPGECGEDTATPCLSLPARPPQHLPARTSHSHQSKASFYLRAVASRELPLWPWKGCTDARGNLGSKIPDHSISVVSTTMIAKQRAEGLALKV
jgi:hypothetical protein